jgi:predicted metal-dependent hydrolase
MEVAMVQVTPFADRPDLVVHIRQSARARRLSLRVSRLDGRMTLSAPQFVAQAELLAFLRDKRGWILRQQGQVVAGQVPVIGDTMPLRGRGLELVPGGRIVVQEDAQMRVPPDRIGPSLKAFFKRQARDDLQAACTRYAGALGVEYGKITLRDTRSRWGSCTSRGDLMFSWRLIMAPPAVLDYVAAHEVAHRLEMNHSPRFWGHVARVMPEYKAHQTWLRHYANQLHAWQFD